MAVSRAMEMNFDDLVMVQDESVLGGREVTHETRPAHDLKEGRDARRVVLNPIEQPLLSA